MSWTRQVYGKKEMPFNYSEYICDTILDLAELPTNITEGTGNIELYNAKCAIGSIAMVTSPEFTVHMLDNNNNWTEL